MVLVITTFVQLDTLICCDLLIDLFIIQDITKDILSVYYDFHSHNNIAFA